MCTVTSAEHISHHYCAPGACVVATSNALFARPHTWLRHVWGNGCSSVVFIMAALALIRKDTDTNKQDTLHRNLEDTPARMP